MTKVEIHTDGGCRGNPGPGAWAAILRHNEHVKEISGSDPQTTNNRMEIMAAIEALKTLKRPCEVDLWTDSEYLKKGFMEWMPKWKLNGWRRKEGGQFKPLKNAELWQELDRQAARHHITFHWLRGHAGHPLNERCDQLVQEEIEKVAKKK